MRQEREHTLKGESSVENGARSQRVAVGPQRAQRRRDTRRPGRNSDTLPLRGGYRSPLACPPWAPRTPRTLATLSRRVKRRNCKFVTTACRVESRKVSHRAIGCGKLS